jgi:hypothetical protein
MRPRATTPQAAQCPRRASAASDGGEPSRPSGYACPLLSLLEARESTRTYSQSSMVLRPPDLETRAPRAFQEGKMRSRI